MLISRSNFSTDFVTVHFRHHDVEADEIGFFGFPKFDRDLPVFGENGGKAFGTQAFVDRIERHGIIFGDENFDEAAERGMMLVASEAVALGRVN